MRHALGSIVILLLVAGCERVPVYAVKVEASDLQPIVGYRRTDVAGFPDWDRHWGFRDDWHRLFVKLRAYPDGLGLYVRALDNSDSPPPDYWSGSAGRPLFLTATSDCPSTVRYFERASNAKLYNFDKPGYPSIYPYAAETPPPNVAAILNVSECDDVRVRVRIQVLDDDGSAVREYRMALHREEIDWYYNIPLFE